MRKTILIFSCCAFFALAAMAQRTEALLEKNWKFTKGDVPEATQTNFDDSKWETVTIPHDWAIFGPFDRNNDLQEVAVTQDLEKQASVKTGRTGGLPYVGVGWYRTSQAQRARCRRRGGRDCRKDSPNICRNVGGAETFCIPADR